MNCTNGQNMEPPTSCKASHARGSAVARLLVKILTGLMHSKRMGEGSASVEMYARLVKEWASAASVTIRDLGFSGPEAVASETRVRLITNKCCARLDILFSFASG